jgi:rod shape-determining protein MreD
VAGLTERLDPWRWIGVPMAACIGATILLSAPIRVFGLQPPQPMWAMVPAFAWAVLRPSILAPFCLLLLGLVCDLVSGGRLGLTSLLLLTAYGFVLITRNMMSGQSRLMMWVWYAVAWSAGMGVAVMAITQHTGHMPSALSLAALWLQTALLYPLADHLIARFEDADPRFR